MFLLLHLFLVLMITNAHYLNPPKTGLILRQKRATSLGSCPVDTIECLKALDDSQTKQFKCDNDEVCPDYYKCCEDSCFQHRICKLSQNSKNPEQCPAEKLSCHTPLHYDQTSKFSCYSSDQCAEGYACCEDTCFWHKICKEGTFTIPGSDAVVSEEKINKDVNVNDDKGGTDFNVDSTESPVSETFEDADPDDNSTTLKPNNFQNGDEKGDDNNSPHNDTSAETDTSDGVNGSDVTDVNDVERATEATDNVNNVSETVDDNDGDSNTDSNDGATDDNYEDNSEDNFNGRSKNGTDNENRDEDENSEEKGSEDEDEEDEEDGSRLGGLFGL